MNNKFKIEYSIYAIGAFIALVGVLFLIVRSDAVLKYRYFNESAEQTVVQQEVKASQSKPAYLLLTGTDQPVLQEKLKKRLELMGKTVEVRPLSSIESETDLKDYTSVLVATEQIDLLKETDILLQFVKKGGALFLTVRPAPGPALSTLYQPIGLVETGQFVETTGIQLTQPFFSETGPTVFESDAIINSSLSVRLSNDAELFASSSSGIPLLWKVYYGEGAFVVFNGTMFTETANQALFVKGIQESSEYVIMPIVNARVTELAGFPFDVPDGRDLSTSYTNRDYYRSVVWPELQRTESKFDLNYTASYKAPEHAAIPADPTPALLDDLQLYGHELLRMGGEIAIRHTELKPSEKAAESQKSSLRHVQEALPEYPIRSAVGSFPEADHYLGADIATALIPNAYIERREDTVVLPKTVEGFGMDDTKLWHLLNEVALSGFYAQSLSPSRFLEEENAEEQLSAFADAQQSINNQLPWLRSLTLSKAAEAVYPYTNSDLYDEQTGNTLTFYATAMKEDTLAYYFFSTDRTIADTENCEVTKIGKGLYLVAADKLTFSIILGGSK